METLRSAFISKYPKRGKVIELWEQATGAPFAWDELSKVRLQKFADYAQSRVSPNSARQYCAQLKAVLSLYSDETDLPKGFQKVLSPKAEKPVNVFLTAEELAKIAEYQPQSDAEKIVRAQFLMGAYSGARHSDFLRFDSSNIVGGNLEYVSQKTRMHSVVPCKPIVRRLIESMSRCTVADSTFNDTIRAICRKCGIDSAVKVYKAGKEQTGKKYQFVSSHTARRSFATNLYLAGLDIYTISRFLGHSSVEMTAQNYICAEIRELSPQVQKYFE